MTRPDLKNLFEDAVADGQLSRLAAGSISIVDLGAAISQGLGVSIDDVGASEVTLVTMLIDDSSSIAACDNEGVVRDGHNLIVAALESAPGVSDFFVHTRYLNGKILYPYVAVADAPAMDAGNFQASGYTPLYDQTMVTLATVVAKLQELTNAGIAARAVTVLITDGADCGSKRSTAREVATLIGDLVCDERHVVAAMGIRDGQTDFAAVFQTMGIPAPWILTPANTGDEIRRAFQVVSQSAIQIGTRAATGLGGFGS